MNCTFDATLRNTTTYWGQATSDEMCLAFFAYYPQTPNFIFCGQYKSVESCGSISTLKSDRCDMTTFMNYASLLPKHCSTSCSNITCVKALHAALMTGCQRDDDVLSVLQGYFPTIYSTLSYCALVQPPASTVCTSPGSNQLSSHCSLIRSYSGSIPLLAFVVYARCLF